MLRRRMGVFRWGALGVPVVCGALVVTLMMTTPAAKQSSGAQEILDRYDAGDHDAVVADLARWPDGVATFANALKAAAPRWIDLRGSRDAARRRVIVATVALEAARNLPPRPAENPARADVEAQWDQRRDLLVWASEFIRASDPPLPAERLWDLAVSAFLEGSRDAPFNTALSFRADALRQLAQARERFPSEPRFALAEGVVEEIADYYFSVSWPIMVAHATFDIRVVETPQAEPRADVVPNDRAVQAFSPRDWRFGVRSAVRIFAGLEDDPAVGAEAHLRLGEAELRLNQPELALPHFDVVERMTSEPFLLYLADFFRGLAFTTLRRQSDAVAAFHAALLIVPHAQSATSVLAWVLIVTGQRGEASAVVAERMAARPTAADPFALYRNGDARLLPEFLTELRRALR